MATRLRVIANFTQRDLLLTNNEHYDDKLAIPATSLVKTGGSDKDYVRIPDCSNAQYYNDHHLRIGTDDIEDLFIALWNNDREGHKLYWANEYSETGDNSPYGQKREVRNSENYDDVGLEIHEVPTQEGKNPYFKARIVKL